MFVVLNLLEPYRLDFAAAFIIAFIEYKCFNGIMFKPSPVNKMFDKSLLFKERLKVIE